jgi:hypothetical protein
MNTYIFDYKDYLWAKCNFNKIEWSDFALAVNEFADWPAMPNPAFGRCSRDCCEWRKLFTAYFGKRCTFPFMLRLINSVLLTAGKPPTVIAVGSEQE